MIMQSQKSFSSYLKLKWDVIDFSGLSSANTFADVLVAAYQVGNDTRIDFGNDGALNLQNVNLAQLNEDDFKFA